MHTYRCVHTYTHTRMYVHKHIMTLGLLMVLHIHVYVPPGKYSHLFWQLMFILLKEFKILFTVIHWSMTHLCQLLTLLKSLPEGWLEALGPPARAWTACWLLAIISINHFCQRKIHHHRLNRTQRTAVCITTRREWMAKVCHHQHLCSPVKLSRWTTGRQSVQWSKQISKSVYITKSILIS